MRNPETIFASVMSVLCVLYLYFSWKIDFGSMAEPSAGFMPILLGFMGLTTCLILLVNSCRAEPVNKDSTIPREGARRFVGCIISSIFFIPIFQMAGAIIGVFSIVLALTKILGSQGWQKPIILAIISSATAFILFYMILDVPLPRGIF